MTSKSSIGKMRGHAGVVSVWALLICSGCDRTIPWTPCGQLPAETSDGPQFDAESFSLVALFEDPADELGGSFTLNTDGSSDSVMFHRTGEENGGWCLFGPVAAYTTRVSGTVRFKGVDLRFDAQDAWVEVSADGRSVSVSAYQEMEWDLVPPQIRLSAEDEVILRPGYAIRALSYTLLGVVRGQGAAYGAGLMINAQTQSATSSSAAQLGFARVEESGQ